MSVETTLLAFTEEQVKSFNVLIAEVEDFAESVKLVATEKSLLLVVEHSQGSVDYVEWNLEAGKLVQELIAGFSPYQRVIWAASTFLTIDF